MTFERSVPIIPFPATRRLDWRTRLEEWIGEGKFADALGKSPKVPLTKGDFESDPHSRTEGISFLYAQRFAA